MVFARKSPKTPPAGGAVTLAVLHHYADAPAWSFSGPFAVTPCLQEFIRQNRSVGEVARAVTFHRQIVRIEMKNPPGAAITPGERRRGLQRGGEREKAPCETCRRRQPANRSLAIHAGLFSPYKSQYTLSLVQ